MSLYRYRALANGIRTDHPIPDLPFVDDAHIPVDDRVGIEAIGRHDGGETWGREDRVAEGGWVAFTTDPARHDLAWCVRWHPDHGRSVVLYRDGEAASVHVVWQGPALLFRSGGYWWDGMTWYRPSQIYDGASEDYARRPVPAATTVTAADLLDGTGDPARARVLDIGEVDPDAQPAGRWLDHLALWASARDDESLAGCVVKFAAPELSGDQLVGVAEVAEIAGVAASTLRAYIARGEGDVPQPQATISGRSVWARPVAEEWAERRRRSADGVTAAVSRSQPGPSRAPGVTDVWDRFSRSFFNRMWESPEWRKRWALRWRNEASVRELAKDLSWDVAASIDRLVPTADLATTISYAVLHEFSRAQHDDPALSYGNYAITPRVTRTLDWLIRHDPPAAHHAIDGIVGEAERQLDIRRQVSEESLRRSLSLDGTLDRAALDAFLDRVLIPE